MCQHKWFITKHKLIIFFNQFEFDSFPWLYNTQQTTQNDDEPLDWTLNKSDSDLNPTNWATSVKRNSSVSMNSLTMHFKSSRIYSCQ